MNASQKVMQELRSSRCLCGKSKRTHNSFCAACYSSLPPAIRAALYRRLRLGYEEAYEKAKQLLGLTTDR